MSFIPNNYTEAVKNFSWNEDIDSNFPNPLNETVFLDLVSKIRDEINKTFPISSTLERETHRGFSLLETCYLVVLNKDQKVGNSPTITHIQNSSDLERTILSYTANHLRENLSSVEKADIYAITLLYGAQLVHELVTSNLPVIPMKQLRKIEGIFKHIVSFLPSKELIILNNSSRSTQRIVRQLDHLHKEEDRWIDAKVINRLFNDPYIFKQISFFSPQDKTGPFLSINNTVGLIEENTVEDGQGLKIDELNSVFKKINSISERLVKDTQDAFDILPLPSTSDDFKLIVALDNLKWNIQHTNYEKLLYIDNKSLTKVRENLTELEVEVKNKIYIEQTNQAISSEITSLISKLIDKVDTIFILKCCAPQKINRSGDSIRLQENASGIRIMLKINKDRSVEGRTNLGFDYRDTKDTMKSASIYASKSISIIDNLNKF